MSDAMVFPDSNECLMALIDQTQHDGDTVTSVLHLQVDSHGMLLGPFPLVHITGSGGTQGYVDKVERRTVDVYAPGQQAKRVLDSINAFIVGVNVDTPAGYLDAIDCAEVPDDAPYQSDTLNKASATFLVTSRPIF